MGIAKTLARIQEAYKWPRVHKDVVDFVRRCPPCVVNRDKLDKPLPDSMPLAQYPGQVWTMDICGPFPPSNEQNCYILTFIDHSSGFAEAVPMKDKSAKSVYEVLHRVLIPWAAPPEIMIMDNSLEFRSTIVQGYLRELGIDVRHICPWNAKSNGKLERMHRTLKDIIRKLTNARPHLWEDALGDALLAHRTTPSDITCFSPFFSICWETSAKGVLQFIGQGGGVGNV